MMPGMNGRELAAITRKKFPQRARAVRHRVCGHPVQGSERARRRRVVHREAVRNRRPARGDAPADVRTVLGCREPPDKRDDADGVVRRSPAREDRPAAAQAADGLNVGDRVTS